MHVIRSTSHSSRLTIRISRSPDLVTQFHCLFHLILLFKALTVLASLCSTCGPEVFRILLVLRFVLLASRSSGSSSASHTPFSSSRRIRSWLYCFVLVVQNNSHSSEPIVPQFAFLASISSRSSSASCISFSSSTRFQPWPYCGVLAVRSTLYSSHFKICLSRLDFVTEFLCLSHLNRFFKVLPTVASLWSICCGLEVFCILLISSSLITLLLQ